MGVGVDENLALSVQSEPLHLAEEDGVVAVSERDHVVLPGGVVGTALGDELELHGEAEALGHLEVVLAAADWLGVEGAGAGEVGPGSVDWQKGQVYGRLVAASTALQLPQQSVNSLENNRQTYRVVFSPGILATLLLLIAPVRV